MNTAEQLQQDFPQVLSLKKFSLRDSADFASRFPPSHLLVHASSILGLFVPRRGFSSCFVCFRFAIPAKALRMYASRASGTHVARDVDSCMLGRRESQSCNLTGRFHSYADMRRCCSPRRPVEIFVPFST